MPRPPHLPTGIRAEGHGFRAYVSVGGVLHARRFPATTALDTMQTWRVRMRALRTLEAIDRPTKGTLAADAEAYLTMVTAMPTIATRTTQIRAWVQALGAKRDRRDVTSEEIATQLAAWQHAHGWSAGTVNRHRTALSHFYRTMSGPKDVNPVRQVPKQREPAPRPRGLPYASVRAILDALSDRTTGRHVHGRPTTAASCAAAVLRVMAYTGLTPAQIAALTPDHLAHLADGWMEMPGRKKGRGTAGRRRALTQQGVEALQAFASAGAWGGVTSATRLIVWRRAVKRARRAHRRLHIPATVVPYDLRHSFAELVLRTTGSLAVTAGLLGHADERTTRRYVAGAIGDVERAAADQVSAVLDGASAGAKAAPRITRGKAQRRIS